MQWTRERLFQAIVADVEYVIRRHPFVVLPTCIVSYLLVFARASIMNPGFCPQ